MAMKERPIIFSGPMVRAIRADTKTQTRRVVKPRADRDFGPRCRLQPHEIAGEIYAGDLRNSVYGVPGDRLYVKEAAWLWCERQPNGLTRTGRTKWRYEPMRAAGVWYAADHRRKPNISVVSPDTGNEWGWRLKIGRFLPRWASRITLEITDVRVERLQQINGMDSVREGMNVPAHLPQDGADLDWARREFRVLWESLHGPGSWDANPLVWVVGFRRIHG